MMTAKTAKTAEKTADVSAAAEAMMTAKKKASLNGPGKKNECGKKSGAVNQVNQINQVKKVKKVKKIKKIKKYEDGKTRLIRRSRGR